MALTDEDKTWLTNLIDWSEQRTGVTIQTAIRESEQRTGLTIQTAIRESEQRTGLTIQTAIRESEQRTRELVEKTETKLLTAFHGWASPVEYKLRSHREAIRALDLQIEEIAGRVKKLEADFDTRH